MTETTLQCKIA